MANKNVATKKQFGYHIGKYRKMLGLTQKELASYMGFSSYTSVLEDEKPGKKRLRIDKIQDYIDAFKEISEEKSKGAQILRLTYNDMVYEIIE